MEKISEIRKSINDEVVAKYERVVGTGVGNKIINGIDTGVPAIIMFVDRKDDPKAVKAQDASQIVPQKISGVQVDVIEVGDLRKQLGFSSRVRPVVPGYSVSHGMVTAGTIAGVFKDKDGQVVILSNNHVLAHEGKAKLGDLIFQPGTIDDQASNRSFIGWEAAPGSPYIGTLKAFNQLIPGNKNLHDSAIAVVHDRFISSKMVGDKYPNSLQVKSFGTTTVGAIVQKFGRTTGHTKGKVLAIDAELTIGYDAGPVTFQNLIVTESMSMGGDSGSLVLDENMNAVGLLFAGSDKVSLHNPIGYVRDHYGLQPWKAESLSTISAWGREWQRDCLGNKTICPNMDVVAIEAQANWHAFMHAKLPACGGVQVDMFSGSDLGASWGPGITIEYPNGLFKINIRRGNGFGGSWAGQEVYGVSNSSPDQWYQLRVVSSGDRTLGQIKQLSAQHWTTVVSTATSSMGGAAKRVMIGKTDVHGGSSDYNPPGAVGRCLFKNFLLL